MPASRRCSGSPAARRASAAPFDLGFAVGPRLNAAGRLADMSLGIECLMTDDAGRAWAIAQQLDGINREAARDRSRDAGHARWPRSTISTRATTPRITVFDESWHQGVIGIVASRLKDKFYRPTITFAPGRRRAGSRARAARSPASTCATRSTWCPSVRRALIDKFGGHAMAAGLTIRADNLEALHRGVRSGRASLADQVAAGARARNRRPAGRRLLLDRLHRADGRPRLGPGLRAAGVLRRPSASSASAC